MRFSVVAVSLFAGAAMAATSTDYVTEEVTITSCAATVTNCPARSTVVSTTTYAKPSSASSVVGTVVTPPAAPSSSAAASSVKPSSAAPSVLPPVSVSQAPKPSYAASSVPAPVVNGTKPAVSSSSNLGVAISSAAPSVSVIAITTCIPTVIYSTVPIASATSTNQGLTIAPKPSSTGSLPVAGNGTAPAATATPSQFTNGASNIQIGGAALAAIFGVAAFLL
ncbi:GPI anchored serine-rich protein [Rutstroemia sp. NJR-2017a WRK4]|nr:GPI anchored serine-rich protein [Rutstroemia sp. NJR-2017a WRK4]